MCFKKQDIRFFSNVTTFMYLFQWYDYPRFLWRLCLISDKTSVNCPTTIQPAPPAPPWSQTKQVCARVCVCVCWNYLLHDVKHAVIEVLLREDGCAVIVVVLSSVVFDKQLLEGHGALLLIGHHQLVAETEQNELKRKQQTCLKFSFPATETVRKCCSM